MTVVQSTTAALLTTLLAAAAAAPAHAQSAAPAGAPYSQIDPNTFIVGHPASPRWKLVHAGGEHPAVLVARRAERQAPIDPNLFAVQPPASVRWVAASDADTVPAPTVVARVGQPAR